MSLALNPKENSYPIFFTEEKIVDSFKLTLDQIHHLRVRRELNCQQLIYLSNQKEAALCEIKVHSHKKVLLTIKEKVQLVPREQRVTLLTAPIKQDLYHLVVQKAVEIGVDAITPLMTQFTQRKDSLAKRLESLDKQIHLACNQCRQLTSPKLNSPLEIKALKDKDFDLFIVADWKSSQFSMPQYKEGLNKIALLVGPEGGWGPNDLKALPEHHNLCLSQNILRSETACILLCGQVIQWLSQK